MIWVALLVRWGINVLALIVVDWMFDGVDDRPLGIAAARRRDPHDRQHDHQADPRDPDAAAHHPHVRARVLRDQRADARARRVDHAGLLDRRLLDVRRSDDRRLARERVRRLASRQGQRRNDLVRALVVPPHLGVRSGSAAASSRRSSERSPKPRAIRRARRRSARTWASSVTLGLHARVARRPRRGSCSSRTATGTGARRSSCSVSSAGPSSRSPSSAYITRAMRRVGMRMATEGPSPELGAEVEPARPPRADPHPRAVRARLRDGRQARDLRRIA